MEPNKTKYNRTTTARVLAPTHDLVKTTMIITTLDYVVEELKRNNNTKIDPYDLLSGFVVHLQQVENIRNPNTIRHFVVTARNFLEYHNTEISPRKFKLRVRLPKPIMRRKEAISKEIREILLSTIGV
jgi:hypothetical protein